MPIDHRRNMLETLVAPFRAYALYAAVKLAIPDRIHEGHRSLEALAVVTGTHLPALRRLIRALEPQEVVETGEGERLKLGPAGELLRSDHPSHLADLTVLYAEQAYPSFGHIVDCIRTGEAGFPKQFGTTFLDYYRQHPEAGTTFDRAMAAGKAFFHSVPAAVEIPPGASVVDVGGGDGSLLEVILTALPAVRGVLAEQRTESAQARFAASAVADRCTIEPTDFFTSVPSGHDVYLLSRILHDWDDDDCLRILSACRKAMAPGKALLIVERVIGLPHAGSLAGDWDLHMLVNTGGMERTLDEYVGLLGQAGFEYASNAALPQDVMVLRFVAR